MNRVGIVGIGKRVKKFYIPILQKIEGFEIAGFNTRTESNGIDFEKESGIKFFKTPESLVESGNLDFIIVCVAYHASSEVIKKLLPLGVPLLVETPVNDQAILKEINENDYKVCVSEQWPFLPMEQFKQEVFKSGKISRPFFVQNDCRSFDYHSIAQLRSYLGRNLIIKSVTGQSVSLKMPDFRNKSGEVISNPDMWDFGLVKFSNGSVLSYNFAYNCKVAPFRSIQSLRSYSQDGTMLSGRIEDRDDDYEIIDFSYLDGVETVKMDVQVHKDPSGEIISIYDERSEIIWSNPFAGSGFDDQMVAVASVLSKFAESLKSNSPIPYTAYDSYLDSMIIIAIKQSAQSQMVIKF